MLGKIPSHSWPLGGWGGRLDAFIFDMEAEAGYGGGGVWAPNSAAGGDGTRALPLVKRM